VKIIGEHDQFRTFSITTDAPSPAPASPPQQTELRSPIVAIETPQKPIFVVVDDPTAFPARAALRVRRRSERRAAIGQSLIERKFAMTSVTMRYIPRGLCLTIQVRCPGFRLRSPKPGRSVSQVMPIGSDLRRAIWPVNFSLINGLRGAMTEPCLPFDCSLFAEHEPAVLLCFSSIHAV
jgi:hypothetical protein